jgi:hypothetical protein
VGSIAAPIPRSAGHGIEPAKSAGVFIPSDSSLPTRRLGTQFRVSPRKVASGKLRDTTGYGHSDQPGLTSNGPIGKTPSFGERAAYDRDSVKIVLARFVQILVRHIPAQPSGRYSLANALRSRRHTAGRFSISRARSACGLAGNQRRARSAKRIKDQNSALTAVPDCFLD